MFTLINILGFLATVTAATMSPIQLITLLRSDDRKATSATVAIPTVMMLCVCNTFWLVYGAQYDAIWTAVLAVITIFVQLTILIVCISLGTVRLRYLAYALIAIVATAAVATLMPQALLGLTGSILSMANYMPAAYKTWRGMTEARAQGLTVESVYSLPMSLVMITTNLLWIAYAFAIRDVWVGLPCVVNTTIGAILFVANRRMSRANGATV